MQIISRLPSFSFVLNSVGSINIATLIRIGGAWLLKVDSADLPDRVLFSCNELRAFR